MAEGDWWFDLETHQVVPDNNDTKSLTGSALTRLAKRPSARSNGWKSATRSTTTTRAGTTTSS